MAEKNVYPGWDGSGLKNYFGPNPVYGDRTSKEGEYRQTGTQSVQHAFPAQGGKQTRNVQVPYFTWFPKTQAVAEEEAPNNKGQSLVDQMNSGIQTTPSNRYQDQISSMERGFDKPAKPAIETAAAQAAEPEYNYYKNFVRGGNTGPAGIGSIDRAYAGILNDGGTMPGRTYQQIYDASLKQGFTFETGSYNYLMDKLDTERRDNLAAEQAQRDQDFETKLADQQASFNQQIQQQEAAYNKQLNQLQIGQSTFQQNQARSGRMGALQIAGSSQTPRTGGTQGFKRRALQINPVTANALSGILGGTKAATTTNTLNV
tara:strand:- start:368 stop:1315 length:948 start_codon:yes stop_codon:yes gene_type:complete